MTISGLSGVRGGGGVERESVGVVFNRHVVPLLNVHVCFVNCVRCCSIKFCRVLRVTVDTWNLEDRKILEIITTIFFSGKKIFSLFFFFYHEQRARNLLGFGGGPQLRKSVQVVTDLQTYSCAHLVPISNWLAIVPPSLTAFFFFCTVISNQSTNLVTMQ